MRALHLTGEGMEMKFLRVELGFRVLGFRIGFYSVLCGAGSACVWNLWWSSQGLAFSGIIQGPLPQARVPESAKSNVGHCLAYNISRGGGIATNIKIAFSDSPHDRFAVLCHDIPPSSSFTHLTEAPVVPIRPRSMVNSTFTLSRLKPPNHGNLVCPQKHRSTPLKRTKCWTSSRGVADSGTGSANLEGQGFPTAMAETHVLDED